MKRIRDEDLFTSALAGDAVLIHVQCVEHMRVAVLPLTTGDCCIEVESRPFCRRRSELAVLLQLKGTEQWIVPEVYGRRLFGVWE